MYHGSPEAFSMLIVKDICVAQYNMKQEERKSSETGWPWHARENWVFPKFSEFSDKNICHYSKRVWTCHPATFCVRDQDATTVPPRHMWEPGSLKLSLIHGSVIYQIPWIRWNHWIPVLFRENSNNLADAPHLNLRKVMATNLVKFCAVEWKELVTCN